MRWGMLLVVLVAVSFGGCQGSKASNSESKIRIALITPGEINDGGISELAFEGLGQLKQQVAADVLHRRVPLERAAEELRDLQEQGYEAVFSFGADYGPAVGLDADLPLICFGEYGDRNRPLHCQYIRFVLEDPFFLAGFLAGSMSKTGKLAAVGTTADSETRKLFKAFAEGARRANKGNTVREVMLGTETNPSAIRRQLEEAIPAGTDQIIHFVTSDPRLVFEFAKDKKMNAYGSTFDQTDDLSEVVLACAVIHPSAVMAIGVNVVKKKQLQRGIIRMDMVSGAVSLSINQELKYRIPDAVQAELKVLEDAFKQGRELPKK